MDRLMNYYVERNDEASAVRYLSEFTEEYPKNENALSWLVRLKGSYEELFFNYEEPGLWSITAWSSAGKENTVWRTVLAESFWNRNTKKYIRILRMIWR